MDRYAVLDFIISDPYVKSVFMGPQLLQEDMWLELKVIVKDVIHL